MQQQANIYEWSDNALVADNNSLTVEQVALRQAFVEQYFIDYNAYNAVLRCGLVGDQAFEYAKKFMQEPFVLNLIAKNSVLKETLNIQKDVDFQKQQVISGLLKEAFNTGAGSTHAARVQALGKLASILGMDAKSGSDENQIKGGVICVPGEMSLEDWENKAVHSQNKLAKESLSDA